MFVDIALTPQVPTEQGTSIRLEPLGPYTVGTWRIRVGIENYLTYSSAGNPMLVLYRESLSEQPFTAENVPSVPF